MIINEKEEIEAAREYSEKSYYQDGGIEEAFMSGSEWAESKFEEIAIEFGQYVYKHYEDSYLSFEELFKLFIKKRNEK